MKYISNQIHTFFGITLVLYLLKLSTDNLLQEIQAFKPSLIKICLIKYTLKTFALCHTSNDSSYE